MSAKSLKMYNPNIEHYGNIIINKEIKNIDDDLFNDINYLCSLFISTWGEFKNFNEQDIFHFHKDIKITFTALDKFYNNENFRKELDEELKNEKDEESIREVNDLYKFCDNIKKLKDIQIENFDGENFSLKPIFEETIKYIQHKNNEMKDLAKTMQEMSTKLDKLNKTLTKINN